MAYILNRNIRNELLAFFKIAAAAFIIIALISYNIHDYGYTNSSLEALYIHNIEGMWGAYIADLLLYYLGYVAFMTPVLLMLSAFESIQNKPLSGRIKFGSLTVITCIALASICSIFIPAKLNIPQGSGGILGQTVAWYLLIHTGVFGSILILFFLGIASFQLIIGFSLKDLLSKLINISSFKFKFPKMKLKLRSSAQDKQPPDVKEADIQEVRNLDLITSYTHKADVNNSMTSVHKPVKKVQEPIKTTVKTVSTIELLNTIKDDINKVDPQTLRMLSKSVEEKLLDFGLNVSVTSVIPGPVITRFEIKLAAGTKVSKISGLSKDLARSLSVESVRIVEVIAGKSVIGLELPNPNRQMVSIKSVLESKEYLDTQLSLPMALGKDISGKPVVVDLTKMPHLLVAGTTGAGKSVGLNVILISLLMKMSPDNLRLILIDPKMLELSIYEKIPHLLTPVVTDMNEASTALRWCVAEMERRYQLMAEVGVRSIQGYNDKITKDSSTPLAEHHKHLPYIIVIADEFADMIMVVGKKVEQLIARLAQKARASGIHLILATQRPSVDVITGLIKANVPSRIAFAVSSKIDSRTILDQQGAEQLLGQGDMLYLPPGSGIPTRVHGAFVSDDEVHRVVKSIKDQNEVIYNDDIMNHVHNDSTDGSSSGNASSSHDDELYDKAVDIVIKTRKASISNIQRRLRIGYNRAATLVECMEEAGVVSAMENNGSREVLAPETEERGQ